MSASDPNSAIYVTDSGKDIKNKVRRILLTLSLPALFVNVMELWKLKVVICLESILVRIVGKDLILWIDPSLFLGPLAFSGFFLAPLAFSG